MNLPVANTAGDELTTRAIAFARAARSPNTERAYRADWADWSAWCDAHQVVALPATPATVGLYLTDRSATHKVSSLRRRLGAIAVAHRLAGHHLDTRHPAIAEVLAGIRRTVGARQEPKRAILTDDLKTILRKIPETLLGVRDRAILLIGFAGAFRRSELVALDFSDLAFSSRGVAVTVRQSKTDQVGEGEVVGIPRSKKSTCPVAALEAWLLRAGISDGPVFRSIHVGDIVGGRLDGKDVNRTVKRAAERAGLDPASFGAHSLRSGFCTASAEGGADLALIMRQSRHRSVDVARKYVQAGQLFNNPASKALGL